MAFYPPIIGPSLSEFLTSSKPLTRLIGSFVFDSIQKKSRIFAEIARIDPSRIHIKDQSSDGRFDITVQCAYSDLEDLHFEGLLADLGPEEG